MLQNTRLPSAALVAALEKIPHAAQRMGLSISQAYREIKAGKVGPLVKTGMRGSAVPASSVDAWIAARIAEATKPDAPDALRQHADGECCAEGSA